MDLDDLTALLSLFHRNVEKVQENLLDYKNNVDIVHQSLIESWSHVARADNRIISVHDGLLSSVSEVNEYIIKLNLHINLNRPVSNFKNVSAKENVCNNDRESLEHNNNKESHTNRDGIEVGELDVQSTTSKESPSRTMNVLQLMELKQSNIETTPATENTKTTVSLDPPAKMFTPVFPIPSRNTHLQPPKGGKQMSSNETYDQLLKNISNFPKDSIVLATMMHINISENCIFVAKWDQESTALKRLLACQMPIMELNQLPDFGKIFAVYDAQEQIIPRVLINAHSEGGGYDAYLPDYGEHIHLNGEEVIFGLPNDVATMPAEAIRCYVRNHAVDYMRQFIYKDVRLRILDNNGNDLEVEFMEDEKDLTMKRKEVTEENLAKTTKDQGLVKSTMELSQTDKEMLEDVGQCTSDAVKAVLGFNPTDDKRICRHYDPKIGGCFKGSNCRLLHQPFAPHGATKDKELTEALPEIRYESIVTKELGSIVRVLVTYINSPTQVYVQFVDEASPLVWSKNDVPESERTFKRDPLPLDMVLALYCDGYYYRAQIIEETDGMFKIFYVDYGNTELVTIRSLAQCSNARSLKPHRAVGCFIEGIKRIPLDTTSQATECVEFLKTKLLNVEFDVMLISRMPDGYVIKFMDRQADIFKEMIKHGYVEPSTDNWEGNSDDIF